MTERISDETLVAYVDGELDEAKARILEARLARDPALSETVRALREGVAALRAAFAEPVRGAVPARLSETVNAGFAARRDRRGRPWYRQPVMAAMAASLAIMVAGLGGAYALLEHRVEQRLARLESARAADRELIRAAVATALEKHLSGIPVNWHNPLSGSHGLVEPLRTFRSAEGQWCREYVVEAELKTNAAGREMHRAIACRETDGRWKTRLELTSES